MPHLMKFSFGPVQEFIAAARKLEDLWAGSQMLGKLMIKAHKAILREGGKIIYPFQGQSNINSPNVVLLRIEDKTPADLSKTVIHWVKSELENMVRDQLSDAGCLNVDEVIKRQVDGFLDIAWAAVPMEDETKVDKSLKELSTLFDAAKRTRMFRQQEEDGLKCTLQPNLSALVPPEILKEKGVASRDPTIRRFWLTLNGRGCIDPSVVNAVKVDHGERFSAIGLAKRLYRWRNREASFPSTYSVATAKWRQRLLQKTGTSEDLGDEIDVLTRCIEDVRKETRVKEGFDIDTVLPDVIPALSHLSTSPGGGLLRWEPQCFVEIETPDSVDARGWRLFTALAELKRIAKRHGCGTPPRHYALIIADGDSMGEIVNARKSEAELTHMSQKLDAFAAEAVKAVEHPDVCGRTIYAGGDDLLAVAPVETALGVSCQWRRSYRQRMVDFDFHGENNKTTPATLSVALLIAPANYPLNRLMRDAHRLLENRAKAEEKDALALSVIKGDSEAVSAILPSEVDHNAEWRLETWADEVTDLTAAQDVSSKCMYDLQKDLGNLVAGGEARVSYQPDLISRIVMARLASNRVFERRGEETRQKVHAAISAFLDAIEAEAAIRGNDRFRSPALVADTLVLLRHMRRLACLSS